MRLLEVKFELYMFKEVIDEGRVFEASKMFSNELSHVEKFYYLMFKSAIKLNLFEMAYRYIQKRMEALPVSKKYLGTFDLIEFKKSTNQSYIQDIEVLIKDVIPQELRLELVKEQLNIYIKEKQYDKVLEVIPQVKKIDITHSYIPFYMEALFGLNQFDELKNLANQYKDHPTYKFIASLYLLKLYIKDNDAHRIAILDADFGSQIDNESPEFQKEVYELFRTFYQSIKNRLMHESYSKKLKAILKEEKKTKNKEPEIVLTNEKISQLPNESQSVFVKSNKQTLNKSLPTLIDLFAYAHQISDTRNIREYLRLFLIKAEEYFKFKDIVIFSIKDEMLYHYKKERLYDKQLDKSSYFNTLIYEVSQKGVEFFGQPSELEKNINILTQKPYEEDIKYIYAFPLFDMGVLMIHVDHDVLDPGTYFDYINGLSTIIYSILRDEEKNTKLKQETHFWQRIFDAKIFNMRIMDPYYSTYNVSSQALLNMESHATLDMFIRNIAIHEVKNYQMKIQKLFQKSGQSDEIVYMYQDKQIREKLVSIENKKEIHIISIFEDLTEYYEEKSRLMMEATVDFETSLKNLNALNKEMTEYVKDKGSFMLITFNDAILPIYGYDVTLKFFKEFGQRTQKFFNDGDVYRFSTYQLFVYIPQNDIRSVTKIIKDYIKYLDQNQSVVIHYEKFLPKISIIRYPVVTEEKLPANLYRYLEVSLDYLKRQLNDESYIFFEYQIYENEVFEQQVINYLNQAMDQNQLSLMFHQIIDIKRQIVWQYESSIALENLNIDSKYLLSIAKKRNRLFELEKYHIQMVFEFLSILEKETERLIKITIPVSKETFLDVNFNPFVFGLAQKFMIPFEFIRFKVKGENLKGNQHINQINELIQSGIGLDTTNVDMALSYPFHALHLDMKPSDSKWNAYLKMLKTVLDENNMALIIRDIDDNEQKDMVESLGIQYIEGNLFKRMHADKLFMKIKGSIQS